MRLSGKVAIVTGGNRGIGMAISQAYAREGAKVVVVGRNKPLCDEVVGQIKKEGGDAMAIQTDVSSEVDVARMAEQTKDKYGRIDILVNNAAVNLPYRAVTDLTLEEWNLVLGVNLTGPMLCIRVVLPGMMAQCSGKIINLASLGGRHGAAGRVPYRTTKAGLINMTECVAAEVKQCHQQAGEEYADRVESRDEGNDDRRETVVTRYLIGDLSHRACDFGHTGKTCHSPTAQ